MNIKIICLGKIKETSLLDLVNEYKKRISKYSNIQIIELQDEPLPQNASPRDEEIIRNTEVNKIKENIKNGEYVIALDLKGKEITSEEFSKEIQTITLNGYSTIDFIIGGSLGLTREFVANCNLSLSFSKLTFPHQLFRVFLLEQIFRAFKISNNERYHH